MEPAKIIVEKVEIVPCGEWCYLMDSRNYCYCDRRKNAVKRCHNLLQDVLASNAPTLDVIEEIMERLKSLFNWMSIKKCENGFGWIAPGEEIRPHNGCQTDFSRFGIILARHGNFAANGINEGNFIKEFYDFFWIRDIYQHYYPTDADSTRAAWGSETEE